MRPMRNFRWWILGLLLAASSAYSRSGNVVASDEVKARLVAATSSIGPGQSIWVALELNIRDGWHTYWRNPGDSGEATQIAWTLPPGFTAGDIVWTAPRRFELPPLANYGYAKHAMHLVQVTAPKDLSPGVAVTLRAKASWLVCADVCIPEGADLQLQLPVSAGPGAEDPQEAAVFAAARSEIPILEPAASGATVQNGKLVLSFDKTWLGRTWGAAPSQIRSLEFYPYADGGIEYAAPQTLQRTGEGVVLAVKSGDQPPHVGTILHGVLVATEQSGDGTVTVPIEIAAQVTAQGTAPVAPRGTAPVTAQGTAPVAAPGTAAVVASVTDPVTGAEMRKPGANATAAVATPPASPPLPALILLAILGGLILNLMPCVFPVLSIKAIGLVEQAKKHPAAVRAKGLVFGAGVVSSMLTLAIVLLALRAGGEEIGWGFQLQSPVFVTLMVYLLFAVGLNLSGVFEVGGGLAGVGDGLTRGDSYHAAFFTGVLTTLVATPCTAPFMAAAIGAALTQSVLVAVVIFASLGLGLSLPYMVLSFAPWMRRALPKPGAWMDTMKQLFAFPMYASAAWLLWVLAQQTSSLGLGAALAGALLIALAAWVYQKSKFSGIVGRAPAIATVVAAVLLALLLPWRFADVAVASTVASAVTSAGSSAGVSGSSTGDTGHLAQGTDEWQRYDPAKLAAIRATGKPVLLNFTASWCLTCLVNERHAFADPAVRELVRATGVTLMKGDWTNRDPVITQALTSFGRAGVPLYVVYNTRPGTTQPLVLPQLLTPGIVHDALLSPPNHNLK